MPGFEEFQLLRPVEGEDRYFVYTRWDTEESFQSWVQSQAFRHGHARAESPDGKPVSTGAYLLAFEVVTQRRQALTLHARTSPQAVLSARDRRPRARILLAGDPGRLGGAERLADRSSILAPWP